MCNLVGFYFIKQKTAYELRISDWSSDVFSSDLADTRLNREKPPTKAMTDHLLSSRASCASSIMSSTAATVSSPATNTKVAILITSGALRSRKWERKAAPLQETEKDYESSNRRRRGTHVVRQFRDRRRGEKGTRGATSG